MNKPLDLEVQNLKKKLASALSVTSALEGDLKNQSSLLTQFIIKLSQTTKGIDVLLDNKLAKLRALFTKSATLEEVEILINDISLLLQKHAITNENNIRQMHEQFQSAGLTLQKSSGLPDQLRRKLRALIADTEEHKDALIQYIPVMSQLLALYDHALKAKNNDSVSLAAQSTAKPISAISDIEPNRATTSESNTANSISPEFIKRFLNTLNNLSLSENHAQQISKIKADLDMSMSNDKLLESVLTAFDVLVQDLQQEKNTAKVFLHTLSETLASVQTIVKTTLSSNDESNEEQNAINAQLKVQIEDMAKGVDTATTLADVKADINEKLQLISSAIEKKITLEHTQQQRLTEQLKHMTEKVNHLESQSVLFEKRIQEQKSKSMQDALTKLSNRASFDEYFSKKMVAFHQKPFDLAITVLDLDDFKRINDTYGHTAGDKTLQVIANTLKKELSNDAFIARYGGEEFVLIFTDVDKKRVIEKLTTLKNKIARLPFKFKNSKVSITTSIGVCHVQPEDNIHLAFDRADTALYQAKAQGKNTVVYL